MSYSEELEGFILRMKGEVLFLSPREKLFLKFLSEMGVPESVVREGVERCYTAINPRRRPRRPLFLCFREIMDAYERFVRISAQRAEIDWRRRFREKLNLVRDLLRGEVEEPHTEEEAQKVLKQLEAKIVRSLWRRMSPEERERILKKYSDFRGNREIYSELIRSEVKKIYGLPDLSLYVD